MRTVEEFAAALVQRYAGDLDPANRRITESDLASGEFEVAAISVIEMAPVTPAEVDELEQIAAGFDSVDRGVALRVVAKRRSDFAAAS